MVNEPRQAGETHLFETALRALKETILNIESLAEEAERVLRRARESLAELEGLSNVED